MSNHHQLFLFFCVCRRFEIILGERREVVSSSLRLLKSCLLVPSFSSFRLVRLLLRKKNEREKRERATLTIIIHHGNGRGARSEESERRHHRQSSGTTTSGKEEERCRDGNFGEEESAEQTRRRCVFFFFFSEISLVKSVASGTDRISFFVRFALSLSLSLFSRSARTETKVALEDAHAVCVRLNGAFDFAHRERERESSFTTCASEKKKKIVSKRHLFFLFFSLSLDLL